MTSTYTTFTTADRLGTGRALGPDQVLLQVFRPRADIRRQGGCIVLQL